MKRWELNLPRVSSCMDHLAQVGTSYQYYTIIWNSGNWQIKFFKLCFFSVILKIVMAVLKQYPVATDWFSIITLRTLSNDSWSQYGIKAENHLLCSGTHNNKKYYVPEEECFNFFHLNYNKTFKTTKHSAIEWRWQGHQPSLNFYVIFWVTQVRAIVKEFPLQGLTMDQFWNIQYYRILMINMTSFALEGGWSFRWETSHASSSRR